MAVGSMQNGRIPAVQVSPLAARPLGWQLAPHSGELATLTVLFLALQVGKTRNTDRGGL
jgi:hypothetical protein